MTAIIDVLDGDEERALDAVLPARVADGESWLRRAVASTRWQSRLIKAAEFLAFTGAALTISDRENVFLLGLLFVLAYAIAVGFTGPWRSRLNLSVLDDLPLLAISVAGAAGIAYWATAVLRYGFAIPGRAAPGPHATGVVVLAAFGAVVLTKTVAYVLVRRIRSAAAHEGEHAIVLGSGRDADFLVDRIQTHREYGLKLVGYVNPDAVDSTDMYLFRELLDRVLRQYPSVRTLLVTGSAVNDAELMPCLRTAVARGCAVYYVPRFAELGQHRLNAESIWGLPLHSVSAPAGGGQRLLKRLVDMVVSGLALALLGPVMLLVGMIIRRETGGSVLFHQRRIGKDGREFNLLKFQTLVPRDAAEGDTDWNIAQDDRLGPFGRLLRATSIDELPQLWNVLRGDMSLVGPRPERPHYVELFSAQYSHYAERHRVPVGLTGWAQIHRLRGDTSIDDRARFDNAYCDQWSVWSDSKIILKTIPEIFRHSGG